MACEKRLKVKEETMAILAKCIQTQVEEDKEVDVAALVIQNGHLVEQCCTYKGALQEWADNRWWQEVPC